MNKIKSIIEYMPECLSKLFENIDVKKLNMINEIRLRRNKPIVLIIKNTSYFINRQGILSDTLVNDCYIIDSCTFDNLFLKFCDYSIHSNIENLKRGFLTLSNGSRVGIAATGVFENNECNYVKNVIAMNIRVPQEVKGCSKPILNSIYVNSIPSVIVAGKPNSGKTTILRDLAYELSSGFNNNYRKVAIIDERNEFGAKHENDLAMNIGVNTDILTYFSKPIGIEIATRALSPEIIICDEVSTQAELSSIMYAFSSGISFALSVHINDKDDLFTKPIVNRLLSTRNFEYIILLDNYTYIPKIIDANEVLSEIHRNANDNDLYDSYWSWN